MKMTKIKYQTWEVNYENGNRAIRHHNTDIVTFYPDGTIALDNGGHYSSTTKSRMNDHLPNKYRVYQRNYEWFVENTDTGKVEIYCNGIVLR